MTSEPPPPDPNAGDKFRKKATAQFQGFVVLLVLVSLSLPVIGWLMWRWWGLGGGGVVGLGLLVVGLLGGTMLYAMSQDGG